MKPISVHTNDQVDSSTDVHWDREGSTVSCTVEYMPASAPGVPTLSEKLDQRFSIGKPVYILTGGSFSMSLDSQKRIKDWDLYTNPVRWSRCALPFAEAIPATVHIDAAFDENGRSDDMGEPDIFYEPQRGALYLSWAESSIWYAVAPGLALGVTEERHFAQLRVDGLSVPDARHLSLWGRLRKLI
jgi:hypothetical protein